MKAICYCRCLSAKPAGKSCRKKRKSPERLGFKRNLTNNKNDYPSDDEIERTKEIIKLFNNNNGIELTRLYLKSDVLLLACIFEKLIKASVNDFGINPLFCVSLSGSTWQCALKQMGIKLQTLRDRDLYLTLENNVRGKISSVVGYRYVKSNENRKICFIDATNIYGHSMSQPLP